MTEGVSFKVCTNQDCLKSVRIGAPKPPARCNFYTIVRQYEGRYLD